MSFVFGKSAGMLLLRSCKSVSKGIPMKNGAEHQGFLVVVAGHDPPVISFNLARGNIDN